MKRVIRDHIHFREEIFAYAEEIVKALGGDFSFSCIHVRRNDFQFEEVWTPAEKIVENTQRLFKIPNETIYISTDELSVSKTKKTVFDPAATNKAGKKKRTRRATSTTTKRTQGGWKKTD